MVKRRVPLPKPGEIPVFFACMLEGEKTGPVCKGKCARCGGAIAYDADREPFVQTSKAVLVCRLCAETWCPHIPQLKELNDRMGRDEKGGSHGEGE